MLERFSGLYVLTEGRVIQTTSDLKFIYSSACGELLFSYVTVSFNLGCIKTPQKVLDCIFFHDVLQRFDVICQEHPTHF